MNRWKPPAIREPRTLALVLAVFGALLGLTGEVLDNDPDPVLAFYRSGLWYLGAIVFIAAGLLVLSWDQTR